MHFFRIIQSNNIIILIAGLFALLFSANVSIGQISDVNQHSESLDKNSTLSTLKIADQLPAFAEGDLALQRYIENHLLIPQKAMSNQINGDVLIDFIVNEDGSLSDIEVLKDLGHGCGESAIDLVENMPLWKPGIRNGKPTKMAYTLVVPFKLKPDFIKRNKPLQAQAPPKSLRSYIAQHQTIAIVPVDVIITDLKPIKNRKSDPDSIIEEEKDLQTAIQYELYQRMLWLKKRDRLKDVRFQDITITNKLLENNGINNIKDLIQRPPEEVAGILGVDAIFSCTANIEKILSKGGAIVISSLNNNRTPPTDYYYFRFNIFDGDDGKLIWSREDALNNAFVFRKRINIFGELLKKNLTEGFPYHYRF